jgi:hypothetical protein
LEQQKIDIISLTEDLIRHAALTVRTKPSVRGVQDLFVDPKAEISLPGLRAALVIAAVDLKNPADKIDYILRAVAPGEPISASNMFDALYHNNRRDDGTYHGMEDLDDLEGAFRVGLKSFARFVGEINGTTMVQSDRCLPYIFLGLYRNMEWARAMAAATNCFRQNRNLRDQQRELPILIDVINRTFSAPENC